MHLIQDSVIYIRSPCNRPTFISASAHQCSASSQHWLFTFCHYVSATYIILITNN